MSCSEVTTLLPWLVNGTLPSAEAGPLREHLRRCAACRRELAATLGAWELFSTHLPAADLVAYAFGAELDAPAGDEVEAHLEGCPQCRQELALIREDPSEAEPSAAPRRSDSARVVPLLPRVSPAAGKRGRALAGAALAAGLAAAAMGGYWWRDRSTAAPAADLVLVELQPSGHALRGGAAPPTPPKAGRAALLALATDDVTPYAAYRIELRDAGGEVLWHSDHVRRQEAGDFLLHLPAGALPSGMVEVRLLARRDAGWRLLERYSVLAAP